MSEKKAASGEQQRAEREQFRKFALEKLKLSAEYLERDRDGEYTHYRLRKYWHVWQAAYSLGWDTMKEQAAKVAEDSIRGWEFKRGIGKCKLAEAIRAIPRP